MSPAWSILICAIRERRDNLLNLLGNLSVQMHMGVEVVVCMDNCELSYPAKSQKLLESSDATFVSFIDDDDDVATDYIPCVMSALARYRMRFGDWPDYVGFNVLYTVDGVPQLPVQHSLHHKGWNVIDDRPPVLTRDITQFNPIRRELALLGQWTEPGWQADWRWANQVRDTDRVRTQVFVDMQLYYKRDYSSGDFRAGHQPVPGPESERPSYPWLRWI